MQGSFRLGSCAIMLALVTTVLATIARGAADIQVLSQNDTSLSMRFTDAANNIEVFTFGRPDANAVWKSTDPSAGRGIRFGNDAPVFASVRFLASRNIPVLSSLVTFDSSIADVTMEDITVFELSSGTVVIGLWNHGKITHIAWVGSLIQQAQYMMEQGVTPGSFCSTAVAGCCGTLSIPGPPAGDLYPADADWCEIATNGGCSDEQKDDACQCAVSHCQPTSPANDFCQVYDAHCEAPPQPDPVEDLLQHILELLHVIAQTIECHLQGGQWVEGECLPGP